MKIPADDITGNTGLTFTEMKVTIDDTELVLDLCPQSADALKGLLDGSAPEKFKALFVPQQREPEPTTTTTSHKVDGETAKMRKWLREHGHEVPDKGKLSNDLMTAYRNKVVKS